MARNLRVSDMSPVDVIPPSADAAPGNYCSLGARGSCGSKY